MISVSLQIEMSILTKILSKIAKRKDKTSSETRRKSDFLSIMIPYMTPLCLLKPCRLFTIISIQRKDTFCHENFKRKYGSRFGADKKEGNGHVESNSGNCVDSNGKSETIYVISKYWTAAWMYEYFPSLLEPVFLRLVLMKY